MLITTLDMRYTAFCPTPENFDREEDFYEYLDPIIEAMSDAIYIENKLAMKGVNLDLL